MSLLTRVLIMVMALSLCACGGAATKEPTAGAMLPNLTNYHMTDTLDVQEAITKFAGAASLGTGQLEMTAVIAGVNSIVGCYQQAGAVAGRTYVNQAEPLKSGVVVIINRNVLTDPNLFLNCVVPSGVMRAQAAVPQPCGNAYTLNKDNNQFYIGYAATDTEVCSTFCSSHEVCTAP
jgi:hypothetical protein